MRKLTHPEVIILILNTKLNKVTPGKCPYATELALQALKILGQFIWPGSICT